MLEGEVRRHIDSYLGHQQPDGRPVATAEPLEKLTTLAPFGCTTHHAARDRVPDDEVMRGGSRSRLRND